MGVPARSSALDPKVCPWAHIQLPEYVPMGTPWSGIIHDIIMNNISQYYLPFWAITYKRFQELF